jgi:hypothetical protein
LVVDVVVVMRATMKFENAFFSVLERLKVHAFVRRTALSKNNIFRGLEHHDSPTREEELISTESTCSSCYPASFRHPCLLRESIILPARHAHCRISHDERR